jgi:flagellar FliL protein
MPAPANRTESSPETDDAAAPASEPAAAPAASGGFKAWLPLIVMVLLMPALAFAMTNFVLVPKIKKGLGISGATPAPATETSSKAKKEASASSKKETIPMTKLLVNVAGTMGARYLLVSLAVAGSGSDFKAQMEAHDAQLRDMAQSALATKTLADLEKPGARNMIRNELLSGFNNILGDGTVEEIYFPEFAIQ